MGGGAGVRRWCRCEEVVQVGGGGAGGRRWCRCEEVRSPPFHLVPSFDQLLVFSFPPTSYKIYHSQEPSHAACSLTHHPLPPSPITPPLHHPSLPSPKGARGEEGPDEARHLCPAGRGVWDEGGCSEVRPLLVTLSTAAPDHAD